MIDSSFVKMAEDILTRQERVKDFQEQIKEDIKELARRMGKKPSEIKKIITLIEKERKKSGTLDSEEYTIDVARKVIGG